MCIRDSSYIERRSPSLSAMTSVMADLVTARVPSRSKAITRRFMTSASTRSGLFSPHPVGLLEGAQTGQCRLGSLIQIDPGGSQPVIAPAGLGVIENGSMIIGPDEPSSCSHDGLAPACLAGQTPSPTAGISHGSSFDGLLVES